MYYPKYLLLQIAIAILTMVSFTELVADDASTRLLPRYNTAPSAFYPYLPGYFGFNQSSSEEDNEGEIKFEFSAKYQLFRDLNASDLKPWSGTLVNGLFFGYTQKAFWSWQKRSQPFREINFAPEFFYQKKTALPWLPVVQIGLLRHESNGEGGVASRAWNTSYLEAAFRYQNVYLIPRVRVAAIVPYGFDEHSSTELGNRDIFDYLGYWETTLVYDHATSGQFEIKTQPAPVDGSFTWQLQASLYIPWLYRGLNNLLGYAFDPRFFVQWREGYGESLKTHNQRIKSLVIGASVVH